MRRVTTLSASALALTLSACADTPPTASSSPGADARAIESLASLKPASDDWNMGESGACALESGTLYCWGDNLFRQHGQAGPDQPSPFAPAAVQLGFVEMARGPASQFFCGIKADRSAECWGRNGFGMLGRGTQLPSPDVPAPMAGDISWAEITTGRLTACGVSTSGVGYCWGANQRGEVGRADVPVGTTLETMTLSPAEVDGGLEWESIVAGWLHACGITTDRRAYCWGDNSRGQLGLGMIDADPHRSPEPVTGGHKFIQLSLGATHTCGVTIQRQVLCWGENFTGQVGNGTTDDVPTPTVIGGKQRFAFVAAGSDFAVGANVPIPPAGTQAAVGHTCALTPGGEAWCWGWNGAGQLGDGTTNDALVPVQVSGGLRFSSLSLGGAASCGRNKNGIWCWGGNEFGQLGNGSVANVSVPTPVDAPFSGN